MLWIFNCQSGKQIENEGGRFDVKQNVEEMHEKMICLKKQLIKVKKSSTA